MSDKRKSGVPFESEDAAEQQLWSELENLPQEAPSQDLRRKFYDELEHVDRRMHRRRRWLGWITAPGLAAAMGCLFVGVMVGLLLRAQPTANHGELADLQQQVAILNRNLVLDRLENDSASKRLLGVIEASDLAEHDPEGDVRCWSALSTIECTRCAPLPSMRSVRASVRRRWATN